MRFAHTLMSGGGPVPGLYPTFTPDQFERVVDAVFEGVTNAYSARQQWFRGRTGGGRFDPRRDIDDECGFPKDTISAWDYWDLHRRDALAQRVNEVEARETWRVSPQVYEEESGKVRTPFERSLEALRQTLRGEQSWYKSSESDPVMSYLARLDEQSGIGRYGVLFFGLNDGLDPALPVAGVEEAFSKPIKAPAVRKDGDKVVVEPGGKIPRPSLNEVYSLLFNQEAVRAEGTRRLNYLRVFPEHLATVGTVEGNRLSPRFGWPTTYNVTFNDPNDVVHGAIVGPRGPVADTTDMTGFTAQVHWTRVLHVADNLQSSEWAGDPRCHPVLNDLLTAQKPRWASGEGYWKACFTWLFLTTQPNFEGAGVDRTGIRNVIEQWMNGLQRANYLGGLNPTSVSPNVLDPTPFIEMCIQTVCIKKAIPVRVFKGSERGELASSQDSDEWADRLRGRENNHVNPRIVAPFHDRGILLGLLDPPGEEGYKIDWPDRKAQSDEKKASVFSTRMTAWGTYIEKGVDKIIPPREALVNEAGYSDEEAEALLDAAEQYVEEKEAAELEKQQDMIDKGLAPDPTQPPPGKGGKEPDDMDDDASAIDLARKVRPSAPPVGNEWDGLWDYDCLEPLTANAARAKTAGKGGKSKLTGGQWVTLDNGVKVYLRSGRIVVGPAPLKGPVPAGSGSSKGKKGVSKEGGEKEGNGSKSAGSQGPTGISPKRFRSGDDAEKELSPSSKQWAEDPSDYFSNRAVKAYAGTSDSFRINDHLRKGGSDPDLQAKADALASVIDKARMPRAVETYRSINPKTPEEKAAILARFRENVGKVFTDPAFTSTTANKKYADDWAKKFKSDPIRMTVHVPEGAKAAYIPKEITGRQEWEVLVQRGSKFRVKSVEGSNVVVELQGD